MKKLNKEVKRINEIIEHIEKRTEKGDIKFMCDELKEKINKLKNEIEK